MTYIPEEINLRGKYRKYDKNGKLNVYDIGDVVKYGNKQYIATATIIDEIPIQQETSWREFETSPKFYFSDIEPPDTNEGDRWLDKLTGRMYTRVRDEDELVWAEL